MLGSLLLHTQAVFKVEVHGERSVGVDFANASIADMPPRLRTVFEENKLMKDKLKKYKHKTLGLENELVKRNNQVLVLEDAINVLKQQLQVRDAGWEPDAESGSRRSWDRGQRGMAVGGLWVRGAG